MNVLCPPCRMTAACACLLLGAGSAQAEAFSEDAKVGLTLRNFYINRNFVDPAYPQGKAEEWTQSFILDARSGFTQGVVGFGVGVLGLYSVKLDGGRGTAGTQLLPVLRSDDGRSLPQTFQGAQLTSREVDNLTLYGARFRGNSPRNDASMEDLFMAGRPTATSDRLDILGAEYLFNDKATQLAIWHSDLQDIYRQHYYNLIHSQAVGNWTLGANLGYFVGNDSGRSLAGAMDNRTTSLPARPAIHDPLHQR